jgi:putative aminopeptidase FrvX
MAKKKIASRKPAAAKTTRPRSILNKTSEEFLYRYLNNASPTGFESSGQQLWLDYIRPFTHDYITDTYGTAAAIINPSAPYKVVVEAHADEISWFVHYITPEGFIYLRRNGGSDHMIAPSKRVNIHTPHGPVKGIFGWPAIHTRTAEKEEVPSMKNLFLDLGCSSRDEVEKLGVHVGCVATFDDELIELNSKYYVGRALDNRMGGFMIAEVARLLKERKAKIPFGVYFTNSVQEEIGLRGAEMIAHRIKPDVAIVTDVCHDSQTPMMSKISNGDLACGKGPVLSYGPAVQNNLLNQIIDVARKNKIGIQRQAASRSTGTDTDAFAYSNAGVASALISLPLRYMHTTVEMVHKGDVEQVIELIYHTLLSITNHQDFRYLK